MVLRKCHKCGTISDDQYGFCIKCGTEFEKIKIPVFPVCPYCGFKNTKESIKCVECGGDLRLDSPNVKIDVIPSDDESNNSSCPFCIGSNSNKNPEDDGKNYNFLIVLGYIFSILGGIIGLAIAIYLLTRNNQVAKIHGRLQLSILLFYLVIILYLYSTGDLGTYLENYNQFFNNLSLLR